MATKVYNSSSIILINGERVYLSPLKIKYLREFMDEFEKIKEDDGRDTMHKISMCALIAMKQYYPSIATIEDLEDQLDVASMYKILEFGAEIRMSASDDDMPDQTSKKDGEDNGWDKLDLAKLEAELFLLGIWKDYEDLETSLSMPELKATLEAKREYDYQKKKFLGAIQGVDIDQGSEKSNAWEDMKARVFSNGQATSAKDIVSLQGINAQRAGFGIGMGLEYERID